MGRILNESMEIQDVSTEMENIFPSISSLSPVASQVDLFRDGVIEPESPSPISKRRKRSNNQYYSGKTTVLFKKNPDPLETNLKDPRCLDFH